LARVELVEVVTTQQHEIATAEHEIFAGTAAEQRRREHQDQLAANAHAQRSPAI
jgi:hypothetical protein